MSKVKNGELHSLGLLYDRHHKHFYNFSIQLLGDAEVAKDVVQDGFLKILKYRDSFDENYSFKSWAFKIIRHLCYDYLKEAQDDKSLADMEEEEGVHPILNDVHTDDEKEDLLQRVKDKLNELSPKKREIIILLFDDHLTSDEVASILGTTPNNVRVRSHRALNDLRKILNKN